MFVPEICISCFSGESNSGLAHQINGRQLGTSPSTEMISWLAMVISGRLTQRLPLIGEPRSQLLKVVTLTCDKVTIIKQHHLPLMRWRVSVTLPIEKEDVIL